jgi:hypothetical protein
MGAAQYLIFLPVLGSTMPALSASSASARLPAPAGWKETSGPGSGLQARSGKTPMNRYRKGDMIFLANMGSGPFLIYPSLKSVLNNPHLQASRG